MGQAGVDLPDPLGTRPSPGRHGPVAGAGAPADSADAASLDAGADDLLSQLAGEEIDRLLAAADVEAEPSAVERAAPPPSTVAPPMPSRAPAALRPDLRRHTKDQPPTGRTQGNGPGQNAEAHARPAPLSPGAHHVIVPPVDESDPAVQAELDDAFDQLAGDDAGGGGDGLPELEYPPHPAPQDGLPLEPQGLQAEAAFAASHAEPLGELLEQLTAVRKEFAAEGRAEAAAEARSGRGASRGGADSGAEDEALPAPPAPPALLAEEEDEPLNLMVPGSGGPAALHSPALLSDESLDARLEDRDLGEPTSPDERAGLDLGEIEPQPRGREPAPVRPAIPIPLDEDSFLAEEPSPADESDRTPLPVRVLEWVNKPLAGLPEAVRQAMGKVAILTLINAILVLVYVLLVRTR
jgi:hypothetical protein